MKRPYIRIVTMNLRERAYPIFIGEGAIKKLDEILAKRKSKKVILLSDAKLKASRKSLISFLKKNDYEVFDIALRAGESLKDIKSVYPIYAKLLKVKADRDSVILALGGGSVGDAVGFVASTYMRGIEWIGIPTTLLAQVDSSVGGKTGINHVEGKNLIGTFHQPSAVICDTNFLKTLTKREMISGFGETVKYALTFDASFFDFLETNVERILNFELEPLVESIERSLQWKCKSVAMDEYDRLGTREVLNFGHTFGHALESASNYKIYQHGEAVILGMRYAMALSEIKQMLSKSVREKADRLLQRLKIPPIPKKIRAEKIFSLMKKDKKMENGKLRFVLMTDLGRTSSEKNVSQEDLHSAYALLFNKDKPHG